MVVLDYEWVHETKQRRTDRVVCRWFSETELSIDTFEVDDLEKYYGVVPKRIEVAQLKSGGRYMTLYSGPDDEGMCECAWSNNGFVNVAIMHSKTLIFSEVEPEFSSPRVPTKEQVYTFVNWRKNFGGPEGDYKTLADFERMQREKRDEIWSETGGCPICAEWPCICEVWA